MGENICKPCIPWIKSSAAQVKNQPPSFEQRFLQRRHTQGQKADETTLSITDHQENNSELHWDHLALLGWLLPNDREYHMLARTSARWGRRQSTQTPRTAAWRFLQREQNYHTILRSHFWTHTLKNWKQRPEELFVQVGSQQVRGEAAQVPDEGEWINQVCCTRAHIHTQWNII